MSDTILQSVSQKFYTKINFTSLGQKSDIFQIPRCVFLGYLIRGTSINTYTINLNFLSFSGVLTLSDDWWFRYIDISSENDEIQMIGKECSMYVECTNYLAENDLEIYLQLIGDKYL